jgi:hypothetical protein
MFVTLINTIAASGMVAPKAYIDPNTGGMLFQVLAVLLAAISGILFFFSRQIKAGIARLRRSLRRDEPDQGQGGDQG